MKVELELEETGMNGGGATSAPSSIVKLASWSASLAFVQRNNMSQALIDLGLLGLLP